MYHFKPTVCLIALLAVTAAFAQKGGPEAPKELDVPKIEDRYGGLHQVSIAAKIIEFQTSNDLETGLSAYFKQRETPQPYGQAATGRGNITTADITFPTGTTAGITVFLDRLSNSYGDIEMVLQGLVDQNRASILSKPKILAVVGDATPSIIKTVQNIPYEKTVIAGLTTSQVTDFQETGVMLSVQVEKVVDDDGNPNTKDDIFIKLKLSAEVKEEGQKIVVALDDFIGSSNNNPFTQTSNAITAPEFVNRALETEVWVPHGQVLMLGGLYRNTKNKSLSTLPWLAQTEGWLNAAIQRLTPGTTPDVPFTPGLGNHNVSEGRRELVFMLKAELWRASFSLPMVDPGAAAKSTTKEALTGIVDSITKLPQGIAEGIAGPVPQDDVRSNLGGPEE